MKEKILTFLKSKLSGVSESFLLGVAEHYSKTVTEEKQIETTFTDGVIDLLKSNAGLLQTEGDKRATEAAKTALKNYQEKHGLDENGVPIKKETKKKTKDVDADDDDSDDSKMPAWAKKLLADNTELKTKFEVQEQEKTSAQLNGKVNAKLKEKGIPESYFKGRNLIPKSEAEIDQLVETINMDYNGFKQEMAEQGVVISVPSAGTGSVKEGEAVGKALAEKRNTNASDGVKGKKV